MVWTLGSYSTGEQNAFNADLPLYVGRNALRDATVARWTTGGQTGSTDQTFPTGYAYRAYDGRGTQPTFAGTGIGSPSTIYFNLQFPASTLDFLLAIFTQAFLEADVTASISSSGNYSGGSDQATFAYFAAADGDPRLVRAWTCPRYDGVEHFRLAFRRTSGSWDSSNVPRLGELYVGRARIMSLGLDYGSDLDPNRSDELEVRAESGEEIRHRKYRGRHAVAHSQVISVRGLDSLDDVATARAVASDSRALTRSIAFVPRPTSRLNQAFLGLGSDEGFDLPQSNYDAYEFDFPFEEQPPYRRLEAQTGAVVPTCTAPPEFAEMLSYFGARGAPTGSSSNLTDAWGPLTDMSPTGTLATPALGTTSQVAGTPRQDLTGTTATSGWRTVSADGAVGLIGSGSVGGFGPFVFRFNLFSDPGGFRALVGLQEGTALFDLLSQEPTALTGLEFVAVGFPSADGAGGNFRIYHSSGGGSVTTIDTGIARNTGSVFQAVFLSERGSGTIEVSIEDLVSGAIYSTTISTNLPSASTPLLFATTSRHPSNTQNGISVVDGWLF